MDKKLPYQLIMILVVITVSVFFNRIVGPFRINIIKPRNVITPCTVRPVFESTKALVEIIEGNHEVSNYETIAEIAHEDIQEYLESIERDESQKISFQVYKYLVEN